MATRRRIIEIGLCSLALLFFLWVLHSSRSSESLEFEGDGGSRNSEPAPAERSARPVGGMESSGPSRPEPVHAQTTFPASHQKTSDELVVISATAADAIDRLSKIPPSLDVVETLSTISVACDVVASSRRRDDQREKLTPTEAISAAEANKFQQWCGNDRNLIELALDDARRQAATKIAVESYQNRLNALFEHESGGLVAPDRINDALDLLFTTTSVAVADAIALALLGEAKLDQRPNATREFVREYEIGQLAAALIYCRNSALCRPRLPNVMITCAAAHLCGPSRGLLDFRLASANQFERDVATELVAGWERRRRDGKSN